MFLVPFSAVVGGTLVVCPASVVRQWEDEINKFTNHALSVCVHHGDKRSDNVKEVRSHDVVITTYGIVRTEVEKVSVLKSHPQSQRLLLQFFRSLELRSQPNQMGSHCTRRGAHNQKLHQQAIVNVLPATSISKMGTDRYAYPKQARRRFCFDQISRL